MDTTRIPVVANGGAIPAHGQPADVRHIEDHRRNEQADLHVWLAVYDLGEHRDQINFGVLTRWQRSTSTLLDGSFSTRLRRAKTEQPASSRPTRLPDGLLDTCPGADGD